MGNENCADRSRRTVRTDRRIEKQVGRPVEIQIGAKRDASGNRQIGRETVRRRAGKQTISHTKNVWSRVY